MDRFSILVFFITTSLIHIVPVYGGPVGVNYGLVADNLPSPDQVIQLLKSRNIDKIRIFEPNDQVLTALKGSGIEVIVGVKGEDLPAVSQQLPAATSWVEAHIKPYIPDVKFKYIFAGNEIIPGDQQSIVLPALQNLRSALDASSINIPVTTAVFPPVLDSTYPPSASVFRSDVSQVIQQITKFLTDHEAPLLANIYTYFPFNDNQNDIKLDFALFKSQDPPTQDGDLQYSNLFDQQVDAFYVALEKIGAGNVRLVVSETGWPNAGNGEITTADIAKTFNQNLINHVPNGTPKRPGVAIEAYIFALFNENLKNGAETEKNWGLYRPDLTEVYHVDFP